MWKFFICFFVLNLIDAEIRRFSEPLQRFVYDKQTKILVVASVTRLYSLNSTDLTLLHQDEIQTTTTTFNDEKCRNTTILPFVQIFLLVNRSILICSTTNRGGSCQMRSIVDFHLEKKSSERIVASSSSFPSVGFLSESNGFFYIGTTFDRFCDRFYQIPTIAARNLFDERFLSPMKFHSTRSALHQTTNTLKFLNLRLINEHFLRFIDAFEFKDFAFFVTIQQVNRHEKHRFQTKIGRFCQNSHRPMLKSYVEMPLICAERFFYLVKSKFSREKQIFYGIFRNTTFSTDERSAQAICRFSIDEIQRGFAETIQRCVVDGQGSRGLAHLSPETPCVARKTFQVDVCSNDDENFLQYPIGSDRPIVQRDSIIEFNEKLNFTGIEIVEKVEKTFVVLSDDRGYVRTFDTSNVEKIHRRQLSTTSIIDLKILDEKTHFDLIVLTENELIKETERFLPVNCSSIRSCSFCSTFFDRCLWNFVDFRCEFRLDERNFSSIEQKQCSKYFLSKSTEILTTSRNSSLIFFVEQCDEDLPIEFCYLTNRRKHFVSIGSKISVSRSNDVDRICRIECFFSKISETFSRSTDFHRLLPLNLSVEFSNRTRTIVNSGDIFLQNCSSCVVEFQTKIHRVEPLVGIESGGTLINIDGEHLPIDDGQISIFIGSKRCQIQFISSTKIECETKSFLSTKFSREEKIRFVFDRQIDLIYREKFLVVADPLLYAFDPFFQYRSFKSGGHRLEILGENFQFVQNFQLEFNKFLVVSPIFRNSTHLVFLTPPFVDVRSSGETQINMTLILDNFQRTSSLIYVDDPIINPLKPFRQIRSDFLVFHGENLTSIGSTLNDVNVYIGSDKCPLIEFRSDRIVCRPKQFRFGESKIIVSIDFLRIHVGFLIFRPTNFIFLVFSVVLISISSIVFFVRRQISTTSIEIRSFYNFLQLFFAFFGHFSSNNDQTKRFINENPNLLDRFEQFLVENQHFRDEFFAELIKMKNENEKLLRNFLLCQRRNFRDLTNFHDEIFLTNIFILISYEFFSLPNVRSILCRIYSKLKRRNASKFNEKYFHNENIFDYLQTSKLRPKSVENSISIEQIFRTKKLLRDDFLRLIDIVFIDLYQSQTFLSDFIDVNTRIRHQFYAHFLPLFLDEIHFFLNVSKSNSFGILAMIFAIGCAETENERCSSCVEWQNTRAQPLIEFCSSLFADEIQHIRFHRFSRQNEIKTKNSTRKNGTETSFELDRSIIFTLFEFASKHFDLRFL